MSEKSNREIVERYVRAILERDLDTQDELRHKDFVSEYPQSGERLRGTANVRAMLEHYPGGISADGAKITIHGSEDRWVMTPVGTIVKNTGSGDLYTGLITSFYPGDDRPCTSR